VFVSLSESSFHAFPEHVPADDKCDKFPLATVGAPSMSTEEIGLISTRSSEEACEGE
jgi:hypothetical protein